MMSVFLRKGLPSLLGALLPMAAAQAGFTGLGLPGSQLVALSHDGCVAAGSLVNGSAGGFRWSAAGGVELLREAVTVRGLSASGGYVSGSVFDEQARQVAGYWDAGGRVHRLGALDGWSSIGQVSEAFGISDEPRVIGNARRRAEGQAVFEWSAADGLRELPVPASATTIHAVGLDDRGQAYGWMQTRQGSNGVLWRRGQAQILAEVTGEVLGADHAGQVLLGIAARAGGAHQVYRWRAADGARVLVEDAMLAQATLFAVSDDGRTAVGGTGSGDRREAVVWIEGRTLLTLTQLLTEHAMALPDHWKPSLLTAISGDGRRLAGWGSFGGRLDSFVVDLDAGASLQGCASQPLRAGASSRVGIPAGAQPDGGETRPRQQRSGPDGGSRSRQADPPR